MTPDKHLTSNIKQTKITTEMQEKITKHTGRFATHMIFQMHLYQNHLRAYNYKNLTVEIKYTRFTEIF